MTLDQVELAIANVQPLHFKHIGQFFCPLKTESCVYITGNMPEVNRLDTFTVETLVQQQGSFTHIRA